MPEIQNLATSTYDPFDNQVEKTQPDEHIHIRIQQRNGRKTLTTVQGIPKEIDPKRVLKAFKKEFACNGTVIEDENMGEIIQLQGDHRVKVSQFLVEQGLAKKENVKIHGF